MGKIKGWTKSSELIWNQDKKNGKVIIYFHEGPGFPYHTGWYVRYTGKSKLVRQKRFNNKEDATNFAIRYMRSHPLG